MIEVTPEFTSSDPKVGRQDSEAVVLFLPGLNNHGMVMHPFAKELASHGYHGYILELTGHRKGDSPHDSSLEVWLQETREALRLLEQAHPGKPISVVGFSMGGAVLLSYLAQSEHSVEKVVLLAPAVRLPWFSIFLYPALALEPLKAPIPSFLPRQYAAHSTTSLSTFKALLEAVHSISEPGVNPLEDVEAFLVLHRRDELVRYGGATKYFKNRPPARLATYTINRSMRTLNHFFLNERECSAAEWKKLISATAEFLRPSPKRLRSVAVAE